MDKDEWLKNRSRQLRGQQTDAEQLMWTLLRSRRLGGHKFRRQVVLGNAIVDFCCFKKRLIVELDGGQHGEQSEKDKTRTVELERRGFLVLRFWDNDIFNKAEAVLVVLWKALNNPKKIPFK